MKTQIQKLKSSKLYYKKWLYRVECFIPKGDQGRNVRQKILKLIEPYTSNKQLQFRQENNHFNLFCNKYSILEKIDAEVHQYINRITGPTTQEEIDFLLENGPKKILCDKLPKDKFQYRIYFKYKWAEDKRLQFYQWATKNTDKIIVSPTSQRWLIGERKWAQDPFAYVKDDKSLSMIGLQLTGYVKRVEQFVERKQALVA